MSRKADSTAMRDPEGAYKARRALRVEAGGVASLTPHDRYEVEVNVRNLSPCGFMAECAAPVRIGSYVSLDIPGVGAVDAQVRWQIGVRMGGMFLDPISLQSCEWTAVKAKEAEAA
jgi:hypothetical protein